MTRLRRALATHLSLLRQDLRLRGRGLDTLLKGRLNITTPGGELAVNGRLRTDEGTYTAYGQNLAIERGIITFNGDVATPRLDILAVRPDIDVRVGVAVQGSAADPRIRLYSEPEMSEMEKLSWIVTGREPEGMGRAETALLQRAATALLAGRSGTGRGFAGKLGLDDLTVRGDGANGAVVRVGKRFADNFYAAYERSLSGAMGTLYIFYDVSRRLTVRAEAGERTGLDLIFTFTFDRKR